MDINIVHYASGVSWVVWGGYARVRCDILENNTETTQLVGRLLARHFQQTLAEDVHLFEEWVSPDGKRLTLVEVLITDEI